MSENFSQMGLDVVLLDHAQPPRHNAAGVDELDIVRGQIVAYETAGYGPEVENMVTEYYAAIERGGFMLAVIDRDADRHPVFAAKAAVIMADDFQPAGVPAFRFDLPEGSGYHEGHITADAYRGRGIQRQLIPLAEKIARSRGAKGLMGTILPTNLTSMRNSISRGYIGLAYDTDFFFTLDGEESDVSAVIVVKAGSKKISFPQEPYVERVEMIPGEPNYSEEDYKDSLQTLMDNGYVIVDAGKVVLPDNSIVDGSVSLRLIHASKLPEDAKAQISWMQEVVATRKDAAIAS